MSNANSTAFAIRRTETAPMRARGALAPAAEQQGVVRCSTAARRAGAIGARVLHTVRVAHADSREVVQAPARKAIDVDGAIATVRASMRGCEHTSISWCGSLMLANQRGVVTLQQNSGSLFNYSKQLTNALCSLIVTRKVVPSTVASWAQRSLLVCLLMFVKTFAHDRPV